ncbi:mini-chromosome maintenance complex-binding protein isoform X2 [Malania oleifera]|uniref:mini-chromosome maintenance complex-binding protein isoform X2 n=1 Tax=Malania oleifera TaxID=397392 RepID=UPI0025ADCBF0|nr:mini-chromosome maintenance complex-binding protein isoform X2 [Malania oleifera]
MVGLPFDCLANPLGAVRLTFEKAVASGTDPATLGGKDWGAVDLFRRFLFEDGALSQVPILSPASIRWIKPNTLVRFRGMIQDMLGNEFYVGAYKNGSTWRTNKFMDVSQFPLGSSSDTQVWERRMLYCVPIPGQNEWTESNSEAVMNQYRNWTSQHREKRQREDEAATSHMDLLVPGHNFHISPSSKKMVPRLHCFVHRKLAPTDFLCGSHKMEPKPHLVKELREALLVHLTAVLGNDGLAAHFMLLHLLSRVHARVDTVAVGKLSLNLSCLNKESASVFRNRISLALENLIPFTHSIPLTVEYLNSASLGPRKDYQTNRLVTGVLQLADGSHLTIDETQLEAGTLNSIGVENARLLKNLTELQKVEYDFTYYKMDMAADVQLLILSDGKSNILPADVVLPFQPSSVGSCEVIVTETFEAWRWYLATLKSLSHTIESEMQKVVEDDMVAARQADRNLGSQDFSRWLTMGRLMSLSFGETCLTRDHWQMVKELERLRRERLK